MAFDISLDADGAEILWWQSVPSGMRLSLTIEATCEIDYAACQLRLMFAHLGLQDPLQGQVRVANPDIDLYCINGVARWFFRVPARRGQRRVCRVGRRGLARGD